MRHPECFEKYDVLHECCTECGQKEECPYRSCTAVEVLSGAEAHELTERIDKHIKAGNVNFFTAGLLIAKAIDCKVWKTLDYESVDAWMSGRLGLNASTGRQYRTLAETYAPYVEQYPVVAQVSYTRLRDIHPMFKAASEPEREKMLGEVIGSVSGADLIKYIREAKGLTPPDKCEAHDWQHFSKCKICGQKRKG